MNINFLIKYCRSTLTHIVNSQEKYLKLRSQYSWESGNIMRNYDCIPLNHIISMCLSIIIHSHFTTFQYALSLCLFIYLYISMMLLLLLHFMYCVLKWKWNTKSVSVTLCNVKRGKRKKRSKTKHWDIFFFAFKYFNEQKKKYFRIYCCLCFRAFRKGLNYSTFVVPLCELWR